MKIVSKHFLRGSFDDYVRHAKSGVVYDFTDNGKCSNCGSCCTCNLPLTEQEIVIIKRYIKQHNIKPKKTKKCAQCGVTLAEDAKFCSKCGRSTEELVVCPCCGAKNFPNAQTCCVCKSNLG